MNHYQLSSIDIIASEEHHLFHHGCWPLTSTVGLNVIAIHIICITYQLNWNNVSPCYKASNELSGTTDSNPHKGMKTQYGQWKQFIWFSPPSTWMHFFWQFTWYSPTFRLNLHLNAHLHSATRQSSHRCHLQGPTNACNWHGFTAQSRGALLCCRMRCITSRATGDQGLVSVDRWDIIGISIIIRYKQDGI